MSRHLRALSSPIAEDLAAQDASLDVPCPLCHAEPDRYCTNPITGRPLAARVSHWQRLPRQENP